MLAYAVAPFLRPDPRGESASAGRPARFARRTTAALVVVLVLLAWAGGPGAAEGRAAGNASKAAGFIEGAQNKDGGFGVRPGRKSDPQATLWASAALLAAGKNPKDEWLKGGRSADEYLIAHRKRYTSVGDVGLLALIQSTGGLSATKYGDPAAKLRRSLSIDVARRDPRGTALAIFGLRAEGSDASKQAATAAGQALLDTLTSDGAWGPSGNADAVSTALVLQALALGGQAGKGDPAVTSGVAYLHAAQGNDGGLLENTRLDKGVYKASVPATAFAIQALNALDLGTLATPTGKTLRQGLIDYQQRTSGGLTNTGAYDERTKPSVVETGQAFAAFNGKSFALPKVKSTTGGPAAERRKAREKSEQAKAKDKDADRVSAGTAEDGVSDATDGAASDAGADQEAQVSSTAGDDDAKADDGKKDGNGVAAEGDAEKQQDAAGEEPAQQDAAAGDGRQSVAGTVVGTGTKPKLQAKAGAADDGLTRKQQATYGLGALMAIMLVLGLIVDRRGPRPDGAPGMSTRVLGGIAAAGRPLRRAAARISGIAAVRAARRDGARLVAVRRWPLLLVLAAGLGLITVPIATKMLDRAPQGATMIEQFAPFMTEERVESYQRDVGQVDAFAKEMDAAAPALLASEADPANRQAEFLRAAPTVALFSQQWPAVDRTFDELLGTIAGHREDYEAVKALPSFRLFPWFFLIPGALAVVVALAGLLLSRRAWPPVRRAALALGVLLLLAPLAFQMFTRAPAGARMVDAFAAIETRQTVQTVQSHFGTVAVGQGAVTSDLVEPLKARGMSDEEIAKALPASITLRDRWTRILNNLTPMIGVMSDNVTTYAAVRALPRFSLFPWLFVVPGLLLVAAATLAGSGRRNAPRPPAAPDAAASGGPGPDPDATPADRPDPDPDRELAAA